MVLTVSPGDTVRVKFTLTNTGRQVSGGDGFYIPILFVNSGRTDGFFKDAFSGDMVKAQAKDFSGDFIIPENITIDYYNLEIDVWDPAFAKIIASAVISNAITITEPYSAMISNISITKV